MFISKRKVPTLFITNKFLLLWQAVMLTILGGSVDRHKNKLVMLKASGVANDTPEMYRAILRTIKVEDAWARLEAKHIGLRKKIGIHGRGDAQIEGERCLTALLDLVGALQTFLLHESY